MQVRVTSGLLDEATQRWVCPDNPVFLLTPPDFHAQASVFYQEMGNPPVTSETFWVVYLQLLNKFEAASVSAVIKNQWDAADKEAFEVQLTLLQDQQPLRMGAQGMHDDGEDLFESGSGNGEDFSGSEYASFSESSASLYASFSDDDEEEVVSMIIEQ